MLHGISLCRHIFKKTVHYEYFQDRDTHLQHFLFGAVKVLGTSFLKLEFSYPPVGILLMTVDKIFISLDLGYFMSNWG